MGLPRDGSALADRDLPRCWILNLAWRSVYLTVLCVVALVWTLIALLGNDAPRGWSVRRPAIPGARRCSLITRPRPNVRSARLSPLDRLRGLAPGWLTVADDRALFTPFSGPEPDPGTWGARLAGPVRTWTAPTGSQVVAVPIDDGAPQTAVFLVRRWHRADVAG